MQLDTTTQSDDIPTLTLAFGWNIMWRWKKHCIALFGQLSDLFPQFPLDDAPRALICSILQSYTVGFPPTHPRHVAKTNNKTFAFDLLPFKQASHRNNTTTIKPLSKENVWAARKGQRQEKEERIWLLQRNEGLSWTETSQRPRSWISIPAQSLPACVYWAPCCPCCMLTWCSSIAQHHAQQAMLWSILVYSCTSSVLTFFSVVRSKETRRNYCTNWTLSRQSWRSAGWSPKGETHRFKQMIIIFPMAFMSPQCLCSI